MGDTLAGVSVMCYWPSEAKLSEREDKLHLKLVAVRKRIADLPLALTEGFEHLWYLKAQRL